MVSGDSIVPVVQNTVSRFRMYKRLLPYLAGLILLVILGILFYYYNLQEQKREQVYEQEIKAIDRHLSKIRREFELMNYNGPDWLEKWEEYVREELVFDDFGPV